MKQLKLVQKQNRSELISCTKCGKMVCKMHLAPAFITICSECYLRENPDIDKY